MSNLPKIILISWTWKTFVLVSILFLRFRNALFVSAYFLPQLNRAICKIILTILFRGRKCHVSTIDTHKHINRHLTVIVFRNFRQETGIIIKTHCL